VVVTQVFTASGPYTPSPGLQSLVVECIGGGGAGCGDELTVTTGLNGGGGGGSGGYSRKTLAAPMVLGGVNVTIGAGGVGTVGQGTAGTATSFGAFCVANGGQPGPMVGLNGGQGALPGVGDVAFAGGSGEAGVSITDTTGVTQEYAHSGRGGEVYGGSMPGLNLGNQPGAIPGPPGAPNTGAGGTGGIEYGMVTSVAGGNGGSGLCIVTEYCWADAAGDSGCCPPTGGARVAIAGPQGWQGGFDND
jgi:hypothetical protein